MSKLAVKVALAGSELHLVILEKAQELKASVGVNQTRLNRIANFLGVDGLKNAADIVSDFLAVSKAQDMVRSDITTLAGRADEGAGELTYIREENGRLKIDTSELEGRMETVGKAINRLLDVYGEASKVYLKVQLSATGRVNQLEVVLKLLSKGLTAEEIEAVVEDAKDNINNEKALGIESSTGSGKTYAILNAYMYLTRAIFSMTSVKSMLTLPPALLPGSYDHDSFTKTQKMFKELGFGFDLFGNNRAIELGEANVPKNGKSSSEMLNSGDAKYLQMLLNRIANADIIITEDSFLQQARMNCLNSSKTDKPIEVKVKERLIYREVTTRIELAIDEAHFLMGTVPLIIGNNTQNVEEKVVDTSIRVFLAAKEARGDLSWRDVTFKSSYGGKFGVRNEFVNKVADILHPELNERATVKDLSVEETTALNRLSQIVNTKVYGRGGGFGWGKDPQLGMERACPFGTKNEMNQICSNQWEEVLTNLYAREILGGDLLLGGNKERLTEALSNLKTTGDSVRSNMQDG